MPQSNAHYQSAYRARQSKKLAALVKLAEDVRDTLANAQGETGKRLYSLAIDAIGEQQQ